MFEAGAIILAGGRSSRMGSPKAALDWHGSTLLRRVTGLAMRSVDGPVIVVGAPGQRLPELDRAVQSVSDAREGRGPLQGLAAGLDALKGRAAVAFVSATDVPLLHPAFVRRVAGAFTPEIDVVLPHVGGFRQPLSAGYRVSLLPQVEQLLAADRLRPSFLFDRCAVLSLDDQQLLSDPRLARADPSLASVRNLNDPSEYRAAQALPAPPIELRLYASDRSCRSQTVGAWTLGQLADAVGVTLDEQLVATLNGDRVTADRQLPLVAGDAVAFTVAGELTR